MSITKMLPMVVVIVLVAVCLLVALLHPGLSGIAYSSPAGSEHSSVGLPLAAGSKQSYSLSCSHSFTFS
ncbi:MAG: hypothetical protein ACPLRM_10170, partial [Anaerolineae bacterium]